MASKIPPPKSLDAYRSKRDFSTSPEPEGDGGASRRNKADALSFCVQKHLASHLHYDLRLEHGGALLSWAVPKGPSLNPADKRMAVRVEDHPTAYGDFEGVIPSGYGAGVVLLWDRGTWQPEPASTDVAAALADGQLKFRLDGVKLKGSWVLVRTRRKATAAAAGSPEQWLLIKHRDRWSGEIDVAAGLPQSVKSFGDLADVLAAHGEPAGWRAAPPVRGGETGKLLADVVRRAGETRAGGSNAGAAVPSRRAAARTSAAKATAAALPRVTNPAKVLFPGTGFTKADLAAYYARVAPLILPHLAGRAVTLKRYPDGVGGKSFFEKRCAAHRPPWVRTVRVPRAAGDEAIDYCEIADLPSLLWAANLAAIELHASLALAAAPDRPTAVIFDLDPGAPAAAADCVPVALRLKGMLEQMGLHSVAKASGGKGLHVLVPLNDPAATFEQTKAFARAVALTLQRDDPARVIASMSRRARADKVFVDWGQNDRNKTTACVFSVRARDVPTLSWPIDWDDLARGRVAAPRATDRPDEADARRYARALACRQSLSSFGESVKRT